VTTTRAWRCNRCMTGAAEYEWGIASYCETPEECDIVEVYVVPVSEVDSEGHHRYLLMPIPEEQT
jgi:hypothetical protein